MFNKRILTPLLIILLLISVIVYGAPSYVNVGPTTEFTGDVGVPSDGGYFFAGAIKIRNNSGTLEARNLADDAYVDFKALSLYGDGSNLTGVGAAAATALTFTAKEEDTSNIVKGQPVYISGAVGSAFPTIGLADCDDSAKIRIVGLAAEAITQNTTGLVRRAGLLVGIDTLGTNEVNPNGETWAAGALLYVDDATGGLTHTKPTSGRIIKAAYSLYGSNNTDDLLVLTHENPVYITCAVDEDIVFRMGDALAAKKIYFKDYANTEVGYIDSDGVSNFTSILINDTVAKGIEITGANTTAQIYIGGTDILATGEQAIYVNCPSETNATNAIWLTLGSTVVTGDVTGARIKVTTNAVSGGGAASGQNVRGVYAQAIAAAGDDAGLLQGGLFTADVVAGSVTAYNVHVLCGHYSSGASTTIGGDLYVGYLRAQTRSTNARSVTGYDVLLALENEAIEGSGAVMDSAIRIFDTNVGGSGFTYGIDLSDSVIATADIRLSAGSTIADDAALGITLIPIAGYVNIAEIRAIDAAGLTLSEDGGNGLFIEDSSGNVYFNMDIYVYGASGSGYKQLDLIPSQNNMTSVLRIKPTGTPTLDDHGMTNIGGAIQFFGDSDGSPRAVIGSEASAGDFVISTYGDAGIRFMPNEATRMYMDKDGNLKIGDGVWTNYTYITAAGNISLEGTATFTGDVVGNADTCTTASEGDAAVDFFGAGVDAVTDATECTDVEGTLLSIAGGVLNAAIPEDHINATMLKDDNAPADGDIFTYELTGTTGHWMTKTELTIASSGANVDITSILNTAFYCGRDADNFVSWAVDDTLTIEIANVSHAITAISTGVGDNDKLVTQGYVDDIVGGATVALDNLAGVAINTSLLSDAQDTDSLGSATKEWLNLYIGDAGKIYCGLGQDISIHRSAAGVMTLTAANGVVTSAALTVTGALGIGANNLTLTGYVGRDADNYLGFDVDNTLKIEINNVLHSIVSITDGVGDNDKLVTQGYVDDIVAGANVSLSNLAAVAINTSLLPDAADAHDLGAVADAEWANLYLGTYGSVYFGVGQTESIAETAVNALLITATDGVSFSDEIWTTNIVGRDTDNYIGWGVDDSLAIKIGGVARAIVSITTGVGDNDKLVTQGYVDDIVGGANVNLSNLAAVAINTSLLSDAADTDSLGSVDKEWLNLFIGEAGKIYLRLDQSVNLQATGAGILTITAANGVAISAGLTVGGTLALAANNLTMTGSLGATGARLTKIWTAALESTADITINGAALASIYEPIITGADTLVVFFDGANTPGGEAGFTYIKGTDTLNVVNIACTAISGTLTGTASVAATGDAAVDFFGAGVDAVTNVNECTSIEGTLLSVAAGILNAAIPEDHINATMLKDNNVPADEDIFCYELTGTSGQWYSRAELGIGVATSITDGLIVEVDLDADAVAVGDILTYDDGGVDFLWKTKAELSIAVSGVNADITSMTGLDDNGIPLAKVANAASDGANSDITSLSVITGVSRGSQSIVGGNATGITYDNGDLTITGASTTFWQHKFTKADVTAAAPLTIDNAATVYIDAAPAAVGVGPATITNAYALWVDAGEVRIDGSIGDTANRVTKLWTVNLECTNDITIGGTALAAIYANLGANTDITSMLNVALYTGRDADNQISWATDDQFKITIAGALHSIVSITDGAGDNDKLVTQGYVDDQVAGANVNLSNLAAVAINTSIMSDTEDTDSLGTTAKEWLNLYIGDAGKIFIGLSQDLSIHRSAGNTMTLTASSGVICSAGLTVGGDVILGANSIGRDADNDIDFETDNRIMFRTSGVDNVEILATGELDLNAFSAVFTEQVLTSGTAIAWDLGDSNKATLTAEHSFTITITAPSGAMNAQLIITQDGTGSRIMDEIITQADATVATTDVHTDTEIIDLTVDIPTGARIRIDNQEGTDVPLPLVENTIYWAIRTSENHIQFASTKALAIAGTALDLTDQGSGTHTVEQLVKWTSGTLGVLSTAAGSEDILSLTYKTGDKQWYAVLGNNFY